MKRERSNHAWFFLPALMALGLVLASTNWFKAKELDLITIRPRFPHSTFISAPWGCDLPNFEKMGRGPSIKDFLAPAGTEIISLNQPVTSSSEPYRGEIKWVTDDELYCGGEGENAVFFEKLPCWVQIDLGMDCSVDHVWLWHDQGAMQRRQTPDVFEDVIVQLSNDAEFRSGVVTIFNSDDDGSCGQGKGADPTYMETNHGRGFPANGQKARYVRIWGGKSYSYSGGPCRFTEVTVWGR